MSILPIRNATLVYGCKNAGENDRIVRSSNDSLNNIMKEIANKLNISDDFKLSKGNMLVFIFHFFCFNYFLLFSSLKM